MCRLHCLLLASFLILTPALAKKPLTLDALVATAPPQPGEITWAPDGSRFAYLIESKVWLYEVRTKRRLALFPLSEFEALAEKVDRAKEFDWENRNVKEQTLQWDPGSNGLLILAGGDLFLFDLPTGKRTQLTKTTGAERDAKLSPDGKLVAFRRGNDLFVLEAASGRTTRLTSDSTDTLWNGRLDWVYPEELEIPTAYWWSPDSQRIAYLQFDVSREPIYPQADLLGVNAIYEPERYPKPGDPNATVRLGVVSARGGETHWMPVTDASDQLIARVDWLPDSKAVAAQVMNRIQNRLDLLLADTATGAVKRILREEDPHWVNLSDDLRFLDGGKQFLWSSERDGFRHLYLYSTDGRQVRQLTSGEWEDSDVAGVDETRRLAYFLSTRNSPLEKYPFSVNLDTGTTRAVLSTDRVGVHSVQFDPTYRYLIDSFSGPQSPPVKIIYTAAGEEWGVFLPPNLEPLKEYECLPEEFVTVKARDGATLYARLIKPAGFHTGRKYPAVVMIYGGPHAQEVRREWKGLSFDQYLAQKGYVIWELDNRGSSSRGLKWESAVYRNFGEAVLADQKDGLRHLISLGFVDESRVGITGWSFGGFMTLYSLLNEPKLFRAGIAGAPVTDWRLYDSIYTERYLGLPQDNAEAYRKSSPVFLADKLESELLILHNLQDDNVHFQNTVVMAEALEKAGKRFEIVPYPQKTHEVSSPYKRQLLEMMAAFFERTLKSGHGSDK